SVVATFTVQTPAYVTAQRYSIMDLGTLGGNDSDAHGINDYGQVVGWSDVSAGVTHGFIWSEGQMTDVGTLGGVNSLAFSINDRGQVVGQADTSGGQPHGFVWTNGVMTDVNPAGAPYSRVGGINEAGDMCGEFVPAGGTYPGSMTFAFLLSGGTLVNL